MIHPLLEIIHAHQRNRSIGIYSVCSSHPEVLRAAVEQAKNDQSWVLVESTSNQVDQYGGYTGMTPADFVRFVYQIADSCHFPRNQVIFGGDHLGPNRWQGEKASLALPKAHELIRACVKAGYTKIHLDASMRCADDSGNSHLPLDIRIIAERAAQLCLTAEKSANERSLSHNKPVYVIGTDVPKPGGVQENIHDIHITPNAEIEETIEVTREAFLKLGLRDAWQRVIAVVVQPGVEFGDNQIFGYQPPRANDLSRLIEGYSPLVYEAHSTDYQTLQSLKEMVHDHFVILKVGPWFTFAYREAVFALSMIEEEYLAHSKSVTLSHLREVIDKVMIENPQYWKNHYRGNAAEVAFARKYSLSDRIRYYWPHPDIQKALKKLFQNLSATTTPLALISQYLPQQFQALRKGEIQNNPADLIRHKIMEVTKIYSMATNSKMLKTLAQIEEYQTN